MNDYTQYIAVFNSLRKLIYQLDRQFGILRYMYMRIAWGRQEMHSKFWRGKPLGKSAASKTEEVL
jgi:hypothetical protein